MDYAQAVQDGMNDLLTASAMRASNLAVLNQTSGCARMEMSMSILQYMWMILL